MGGGSDAPDPAQTGFSALPGWLQNYGQDIMGQAWGQFQQGPQQFFPGQTFANLDPLQLAGMQSQQNFAESVLPGQLNTINQSFNTALGGMDINNPAIQAGLGAISQGATENFLENVLPALRRGATATGGEYGTRGELAAGVAADKLAETISTAQGQFLGDQIGSFNQLQGAALALSPQQAQLGMLPGQIQQQVGGINQGMDQQAINQAMSQWNFEQQAPLDALNSLIGQYGTVTGAGGASSITPQGQGTSTSPIAGALGGGMLGNALSAGTWLGAGPGMMFGPAGLAGAVIGGLLS